MLNINLIELSKVVSHALRHQPSLYNLELDEEGWVSVSLLVESLKKLDVKYSSLSSKDIEAMITTSKKKRHEIVENKIRASYGHSLKRKILKEVSKPPKYLYHATKFNILNRIFEKGLIPMQRQYVHLSEKESDAINVALRKTKRPILLKIKSKEAYEEGVNFYSENNGLWLADKIKAKYLEKTQS